MNYFCDRCDFHFTEASVAFRHLILEHQHEDQETIDRLTFLFEIQFAREERPADDGRPRCAVSVGTDLTAKPTACPHPAVRAVRLYKSLDLLAPMCSSHAEETWNVGD
jgi:hypothetical protein